MQQSTQIAQVAYQFNPGTLLRVSSVISIVISDDRKIALCIKQKRWRFVNERARKKGVVLARVSEM
jgi:hypothetical protein